MRRSLPLPALLLLAASGCVTLRPYEAVVADLAPESLVRVDGRRVHVDARGSGEPMLLLHGFGASTILWEPVIDELAKHRRVVAIDLNGFGWSERPDDPAAYTLEGQERMVLGVADALGFERFDLAGHSYGGAISIFLASRHPERVRSLVLVDSALPTYASARRQGRFRSRVFAGIYVRTLGLNRRRVRRGLEESYADDSKVTPERVRAYLDRLRVEGVVDAFYGLTAPNGEPPEEVELEAIRTPALLVWGSDDPLISAADGRKAADRFPNGRFAELPGCGHIPTEECPEAFLSAVLPFLASGSP